MLGLITVLASGNLVDLYMAGLITGFLTGAFGHLIKAPLVILAGITLIGLTVAVYVLSNA